MFLIALSGCGRLLLPDIRDIRYIRPCESVAELPSSFFFLQYESDLSGSAKAT